MPARLIEGLATTGPMADVFSDASVLKAMLEFEVALARAEARVGVIPQSAAKAVAGAARAESFDCAKLATETLRAGTPGIPIAKALTEVVRRQDAAAAGFVHWGATSQDVVDTTLVLLLMQAQRILLEDLRRTETALAALSGKYKDTVMLGRTLLQPAPPITFGLKAARWFAAIKRCRERLQAAFDDALVLQLGGASGTLAALGKYGISVAQALADDLDLPLPDAPWHAQRERLAALVCACGVLTGSLGKMARDISLLMQSEIGEAAEPAGAGRGGSSTMPHKRNPIACTLTLSSAARVPGLVASFLSAMVQEHERGVGGWQAEWVVVSSVMQATAVAASSMAEVAEGLSIDKARMRANLDAANGAIFAERAMMLLAETIGRDSAHKLLEEAARRSAREGKNLAEVLSEMPDVTAHLNAKVLHTLEDPKQYLGSAEAFRRALISGRVAAVPGHPHKRSRHATQRTKKKER